MIQGRPGNDIVASGVNNPLSKKPKKNSLIYIQCKRIYKHGVNPLAAQEHPEPGWGQHPRR